MSVNRGLQTRTGTQTAVIALVLAVSTFAARGRDLEALLWSIVQILLVVIAAVDLKTRRIPNLLTSASVLGVVALRLFFARDTLAEAVIAGAICFTVFLLLAMVSRGGLGMGDVKLSGFLGVLLGQDVIPALLIGALCGALAAVIVGRRAGSLQASLAYGPYLCLGAAVLILAGAPPAHT